MSVATSPTPVAEDAHSSLVPVHVWQIDSASQHVTMRLSAEGLSDGSIAAGEHRFRLVPEQARQIIRDLSAAVLAMDLKLLAGGNAQDGDVHLREDADSDRLRRDRVRVIPCHQSFHITRTPCAVPISRDKFVAEKSDHGAF